METSCVTRIAHVSDLHMLDSRPGTRSAAAITTDIEERLEAFLRDPAFAGRPAVVVQHHPPFPRKTPLWQWLDGLEGWQRALRLLERFANLYVMHGHLHYVVDRALGATRGSRVFGAPAVVDDRSAGTDTPRVRIYEARGGVVTSIGLVAGS